MVAFYGGDRVTQKDYLLHTIDTGNVNRRAYGTAIRAVNATRGNRQGNNAFIENGGMGGMMRPVIANPGPGQPVYVFKHMQNMESEFYKKYELVIGKDTNQITEIKPWNVATTGNYKFVADLIEPLVKHENYGFNKLHLDVLKLKKLTDKYATISITKKATSANNVSPIHFACINPNTAVLEKLLD